MAKVLTTPPGQPGESYVLPCYTGELWTIPTSNSTMRLLVTGKETQNAFAVVGTGGTTDKPIGFHFHREAHDVFLCLKGQINVWANDTARTLSPGDFASVPPTTVHQYQIVGEHTEFVGLIVPGGWEEFFRFVGEQYEGPLFPTTDKRNPFEVLIPKLIAATEKFDMIPVREKKSYDPQPWDGSETSLPGICANGGYFLRDGAGQKYEVNGTVVRPMATKKESDGRFSIYDISMSSLYSDIGLRKSLRFAEVHHAIFTIEGVLSVTINGTEQKTTMYETLFVPAGTSFKIRAESKFARAYVFANGGGLGEILTTIGKPYDGLGLPTTDAPVNLESDALQNLEGQAGFTIV